MRTYEHTSNTRNIAEQKSWFTQPGPTESFRQTAPKHLLQDNRETAPMVQADPGWFTQVGPTPSFVMSR